MWTETQTCVTRPIGVERGLYIYHTLILPYKVTYICEQRHKHVSRDLLEWKEAYIYITLSYFLIKKPAHVNRDTRIYNDTYFVWKEAHICNIWLRDPPLTQPHPIIVTTSINEERNTFRKESVSTCFFPLFSNFPHFCSPISSSTIWGCRRVSL